MKNISYKLTILVIIVFFTACTTRVPFIEKEISKANALVYIYVSDDIGTDETITNSLFTIRINSKNIQQKIRMNEYLAFEIKPNNSYISIVRAAIEEKKIELNLEAGKIYYLRVDTNLDNDAFAFSQIDNLIASKEIKKTGLAGSVAIDENSILTEIIEDKEPQNNSKIDEIEKAYKLKEKGIISLVEFEKLKAEILAK